MEAWNDAVVAGPKHHGGPITAGDEELKDRDMHDDDNNDDNELLALHNISLATSPTAAGSGTAAPPAPIPPPRPPFNYRGVTMAAAAAKGDLAQVVLLWGMAMAEGVNIMLPDAKVSCPSVRIDRRNVQQIN